MASSTSTLRSRLKEALRLYDGAEYEAAVDALEELLSDAANQSGDEDATDGDRNGDADSRRSRALADIHLSLSRCHRALGDVKAAIVSCNDAINFAPKWTDAYGYRTACFRALKDQLVESDGDAEEAVESDRCAADIIVDGSLSAERDGDDGKKYVPTVDRATSLAEDGQAIFVERGRYNLSCSSLSGPFIYKKGVTLIGASARDCVLYFQRNTKEQEGKKSPAATRLVDTLLVCAHNSHSRPVLIKRLTFRNPTAAGSPQLLSLMGGFMQVEDCVFDSPSGMAIFANDRIGGEFATEFDRPNFNVRFSVFHSSTSNPANLVAPVTVAGKSTGTFEACLFLGGRVEATDWSSTITIENCQFSHTQSDVADALPNISASGAVVMVKGCYMTGDVSGGNPSRAIAVKEEASAIICHNFIEGMFEAVSCSDSLLNCESNIIANCSFRASPSIKNPATGVSISGRFPRMQVTCNTFERCDVAVRVANAVLPLIKDNLISFSFLTGLVVEHEAKPNVVGNNFIGHERKSSQDDDRDDTPLCVGVGAMFSMRSGGLVGKNAFENYVLAPLMVFSSSHPLLKENAFSGVKVDAGKQANHVERLKSGLSAEQYKDDTYFYIVDSEAAENDLRDTILKHSDEDRNECQ